MTEFGLPTLGSVISVTKGKKHEVSESPSVDAKRLLGIDDLRNNDLIRYTKDTNGTDVTPNDVLIAWDGANAGTIGFGKAGYIGSTIARLRVKPGIQLFTPFLGLYLRSKFDYLRQTATGATIPHINRGALDKIPLPLIELNDQIRIAHLLGKVEWLIAERKQHLQQLDDLLKSIFLEMFESCLQRNGESTLGDCLKIQQGFAFRSEEFVDDGVPIVKIGTVNKGVFDYSTLSFVRDNYPPKFHRYEIKPGDLLISLTGTVGKDDYGNTCFVPRDSVYSLYLLNQRVGQIICDNKIANPYFVDSFLKLPRVKSVLLKQNRGVRQANLSNADIYSLPLSIPPIDLQERFAVVVARVEGVKSQYQRSLTDFERLYGALSQKAFKGELDLSQVPLPAELEGLGTGEQHEAEHARRFEYNVPDNINATLENLNALNTSAESVKAIADVSRLATFDLAQQDAVRAFAEKMASLRSPLQELKQIDAIAAVMERAQAALKPLNLEHIDALTKSVELAHALTASVPHIDMTWLEHHAEAVRRATEPFESMRKAMERIALPTIDLSDSMRLASEAARRLQSSIPDFNAWQQQSADLPGAELDDEEGGVKHRFTREDLNAIFAQSTGPLSFETLFNQLNELETVDLPGYETIKAILFELLAEQRVSQEFDEKTKSLLLAVHNPEAAH